LTGALRYASGLMITLLASYLHDIDPYAIKLWEGGPIRWYGLSYLMGFAIGYVLIRRVAQVGRDSLPLEKVSDFAVCLALGVVIGGRLGYAVFYDPSLLWTFRASLPFWDLLAINRGGMASHGGILGLIVATGYFARRHKQRWTHLMDLAALAAPLGLFFGRLANFVNGELYGRPARPDLPWAVKFPQEMYHWGLPDVYDAVDAAGLSAVLMQYGPRDTVALIIRSIQERDHAIISAIEPLLTPRHPSQIYQALLEGLLLFVVLAAVWYRPRKPLLVAGLFCVVYAVARIIGEFFRQPDVNIGLQWLNLTRGQWLSLLLLAAGLVLTVWAQRRSAPRIGGWGQSSTAP
jgi:phosphatidylglycerol---prolipoprotein diacylglyceryl transferase